MGIRLYNVLDGITKLGPGMRFVIWTQGCMRSCPGCISPDSRPLDAGVLIEVDELSDRIIKSGRTEITISGGEPFLQADALAELLKTVRNTRDIGVIIYTGYTIEELLASEDPSFKQLLDQSDLIIDGTYIEELNDGKSYRGSSNQRAIMLTDRYESFITEFGTKPAEVEFIYQENKVQMVGIPSPEVLKRFKETIF